MSCKPKSLRAADGMELTERWAKSTKPVGMWQGGEMLSTRGGRAPDTSAFFASPATQQLPDTSAEQQKQLAGSVGNQGADQGEQMMQGMMSSAQQNPMAIMGGGSPQDVSYAMGQAKSQSQGLLRGLQGGLPTGGALGNQQPQLTGRPTGMMGMRDGGEVSPFSVKGIGRSMGFFQTPAEKQAAAVSKIDAEQAAYRARQAAPQAPAPAAPAPTGGISGYVGNSALEQRMKAAGLKNGGTLRTGAGGDVPGTGRGDKIPAKYEPGEFVVSNDMLRADPGLRGELRALRKKVLAKKGMTPEMADAQALNGGKGLRAEGGFGQQGELFPKGVPSSRPLGAQMEIPMRAPEVAPKPAFDVSRYTPPKVNAEGYYENGRSIQSGSGTGQAGQAGPAVKVGGTAPGAQAGRVSAGGSSRAGVLGSLREGLSHQPGPVSKSAFLAGRALSSPLVAGAGKIAGAAGVVQNFNDYKINDPDVDSSASGTWGALRNGDFAGAGRSLSKGALETGMDLGSFAANTADLFVPGTGPSQAYNKMLRGAFGDQLTDNSGSNQAPAPTTQARPATNPAAAPDYSDVNSRANARLLRQQGAGDPTTVQGANGRQYLPGALTPQDHARSDELINAANLNRPKDGNHQATMTNLRDNAASMDLFNQGIAMRGSGIKMSKDANGGIVLSNSTAPEKMPYTDLRGNPTTEYKQTRQWSETPQARAEEMQRLRMAMSPQAIAMATAQRDQYNKDREFGLAQETHNQTVGDKAREGFSKEFGSFNPDGSANPGQTALKQATMQKLFPGIDLMSPDGRSKHLPEAQMISKLYDRFATNPQMGADKWNPMKPKGPGMDTMPNWQGGKLTRQGLGGALTPGGGVNNYYVTHNGVDTPLGSDLSDQELAILDHHLKTGNWRGAPKNVQGGK